MRHIFKRQLTNFSTFTIHIRRTHSHTTIRKSNRFTFTRRTIYKSRFRSITSFHRHRHLIISSTRTPHNQKYMLSHNRQICSRRDFKRSNRRLTFHKLRKGTKTRRKHILHDSRRTQVVKISTILRVLRTSSTTGRRHRSRRSRNRSRRYHGRQQHYRRLLRHRTFAFQWSSILPWS